MKKKVWIVLSLVGMLGIMAPSLNTEAAWKTDSHGRYYTADNSRGYLTGWKKIGKYTYYFQKDGYAATGWQYIKRDWYFFNASGRMVRSKWVDNSYLLASGKMAKNIVINGIQIDRNGNKVNDDEGSGSSNPSDSKVRRKNTWVEQDGKKFYYDYRGKLAKGWLKIKNNTYYMDPKTGAMRVGVIRINRKYYGFDPETGVQKKRWFTYKGKTFYFSAKTKAALTGWRKNGRHYYYFNSKGVLQKNTWVTNSTYYVNDKGQRHYGWLTYSSKKYKFYLDPKTGKKTIGRKKIGRNYYYFNKFGRMLAGRWVSGKYYEPNGKMAKNKWVETKYVNSSGTVTKTRKLGFYRDNGKVYYLDSNYNIVKGGWHKIRGAWYYFDSTGVVSFNKWIDGYYVNNKAKRVIDKFYTIQGKTYLFQADGKIAKGKVYYQGYTYYLDPNTGERKTGFVLIDGVNYYFRPDANGAMAVDMTLVINNVVYTFDKIGKSTYDATNTAKGKAIAEYAKKFVGYPYVYGGDKDLTKGVDCSGFTMLVHRYFGLNIPRVTGGQALGTSAWGGPFAKAKFVSVKEMLPGDIVCYGSPAEHVGIYIGNGKIVHASNSYPYPKGGIKISEYNYKTPSKIVRYW